MIGQKVLDGVIWRTPESHENAWAFSRTANQHGEAAYPQVRMVCLMELTSHLLVDSTFVRTSVSEVTLASHGVSAQLRSHIRIGLNVGLTADQLSNLITVLSTSVGTNETKSIQDVTNNL